MNEHILYSLFYSSDSADFQFCNATSFQEFPPDRDVVLPNTPIREIIVTVYKDNPRRPVRVTLSIIGCFKIKEGEEECT